MNNLSLTVIVVMAISIMIGSSMMYADAAKPVTGDPVSTCPDDDYLCHEKSDENICSTDRVTIKFRTEVTTTEWDKNGKSKITVSIYGIVYERDTNLQVKVGELADTLTVAGFDDGKGAKVVKHTSEVDCLDGTKDKINYKVEVIKPEK